jgi:D-methionine transport system permease protein
MNFANLGTAAGETLGMTLISTILAYLVGIPLGICLNITSKSGLHPNKPLNLILGVLVNLLRSVPCMLLIIVLLPLTRAVVGRGTGYWYTMLIPLFFSSFPFVARMVEQSLAEVPTGEIEAVKSMGASNKEIVFKVLLGESKPSLISGAAVSAISILGYTSFAYDFGAGGLISSAYSFYNNHTGNYLTYPNVWVIILVVVILVQLLQEVGLYFARKTDKRRVIS